MGLLGLLDCIEGRTKRWSDEAEGTVVGHSYL